MAVTYNDVENYLKDVEPRIKADLQTLADQLRAARDTEDVPIHLMTWRVKSIDSTYLKMKRKRYESLDKVTDHGGFRILCLFEQDIFPVHAYLLELLKASGYSVEEFKIFNWQNERDIDQLKNEVEKHFRDKYKFELDNKESGYKSLHYLACGKVDGQRYIEIQLRTVLQDVWGELEHAVAYKHGGVHPHIRKSFSLLARDIETSDMLVKHLRDFSDREQHVESFVLEHGGPHGVFWYEENLIPDIFKGDDDRSKAYRHYKDFICRECGEDVDLRKWAEEGKTLHEAVTDRITVSDLKDTKVKCWIAIEEAFLLFCQGQHDAALEIYNDVTSKSPEYYVAHFRKGEILFLKGQIKDSLVAFDRSEEFLEKHAAHEHQNAYRIKVKLANIYWLMGSEYYEIALDKILEAETIWKNHSGLLTDKDQRKLINNLCWYQLEKYILCWDKYQRAKSRAQDENDPEVVNAFRKADEEFKSALKRYETLKPLLDEQASANMFDTAAWFCFNTYRKTNEVTFLERAKEYCREGWGRKNYAVRTITSANLYRSHTQEVMSTNP